MEYQKALEYFNNRTGNVVERHEVVECLKHRLRTMDVNHPHYARTRNAANNLVVQTHSLQADLLDYLKTRANLRNDAALCRYLTLTPPQVSRMRSNELSIGDRILVRIHDVTGIEIRELKTRLCLPILPSKICRQVAA